MRPSTQLSTPDSTASGALTRSRPTALAPLVDVYENADELMLLADMPGVKKENVNIHIDKGQLTLEGTKSENSEPNKLLLREYREADYRRSFSLPNGIDTQKVSAELANGVLCVRLPKSEAIRPRQIRVRAG